MLNRFLITICCIFFASFANAADLISEIRQGNIRIIELTGNGSSSGGALEGVIRNTTQNDIKLDVHMPNPVYFANNGSAQNMIATQIYGKDGGYLIEGNKSFILLAPGAQASVMLIAYCADFNLDNPSSNDSFTAESLPSNLENVAHKISTYEEANMNADLTAAAQVALWLAQGETASGISEKFEFTPEDLRVAQEILR